MALKDKLMTLEDFKAVRDVDVASNSAQFTEIKADLDAKTGIISKTPGYYINLTTDPVDISNPSQSSTGLTYAVVDCSEGDKFVINAAGATNGRAWGFLDSSNHVLSMADANATVTDLELTAPTNAVKLVINDKGDGMSYKVGNNLATKARSDGLSDEVKEAILDCFRNVAWLNGTDGKESFDALLEALDVSDFYNTWKWTYPGNLYKYNGTPTYLEGSSTDGVLLDNSTTSARVKRSMFTNKGKLAAGKKVAISGDIFPIPIPSEATSVSAKINPSTMQVLLQQWKLQGNVYKLINMTAWFTGTATMNFSPSPDKFLCVNIRYNSNASQFQTEPQGFEITFQ